MGRRIVLVVVVLAALGVCGTSAEGERERSRRIAAPPPTGGFGPQQLTPQAGRATVVGSATGGTTTGSCWRTPALHEYQLPGAGKPGQVAAAGDGAVWFSDPDGTAISRLVPTDGFGARYSPDGTTIAIGTKQATNVT